MNDNLNRLIARHNYGPGMVDFTKKSTLQASSQPGAKTSLSSALTPDFDSPSGDSILLQLEDWKEETSINILIDPNVYLCSSTSEIST